MKWHDIYSHCELISSNKIDLMKSVRAFKDMDRLNHLSSLAIELEIELNTTRSEVYKSIERENKLNRFTFYDSISSLDRDIDRYDINLLKQYISSLKEWRTKRVEWLVNAIVAMLAGSVGALITMAFSGATKVP